MDKITLTAMGLHGVERVLPGQSDLGGKDNMPLTALRLSHSLASDKNKI